MRTKCNVCQFEKHIHQKKAALVMVAIMFVLAAPVRAQSVPSMIHYQGRLLNPDGTVMSNGDYVLQFRIWATLNTTEDAERIWGREFLVNVAEGYFNVTLNDNGNPISGEVFLTNSIDAAFTVSERYLGITVKSGPGISGSQPELKRQQFLSSPYSIVAGNGVPVGGIISWIPPIAATTIEEAEAQLPANYAVCNGPKNEDNPETPFDETLIPNLDNLFLIGSDKDWGTETEPTKHTHRAEMRTSSVKNSDNFCVDNPNQICDWIGGYYMCWSDFAREDVPLDTHTHAFAFNTGESDVVPKHIYVIMIIRLG